MKESNHIPAYNRQKNSPWDNGRIINTPKYRPSITRDVWFMTKEIFEKYKPPYKFMRIIEIVLITGTFPFFFPWAIYEAARCACIEKLKWDFEHSKLYIEKIEKNESFVYPMHTVFPVFVALIWGLLALLVSLVIYFSLNELYEYFIS